MSGPPSRPPSRCPTACSPAFSRWPPQPLLFAGIGVALQSTTLLLRVFARSALLLPGLFVLAGLAAVFGTPGLIFAIALSVVQAIWSAATAIAPGRSSQYTPPRSGDPDEPL